MANSLIVSEIKDKIITEIINDEVFFHAINSPDITNFEDADQLVGTHIFRYNQNPITLQKVTTFLTIQVSTYKPNVYEYQDMWIRPKIEIWIISNQSCMNVDNIPLVRANRNDYISQLLDDKFNGRTTLGLESDNSKLNLLGKLDLVENSEDAYEKDFLYRKMIFVTRDVNNSMCGSR